MKKIIILLAFATTICKSQITLIPVSVTNVTDTVNVNDSIKICFTYQTSPGTMAKIQLWTSTYLQNCLYTYYGNLITYPTCGQDTIYVKVKITPSMGTGNARIYSNATIGNYKPFYIRSNAVSVNEYTNGPDIVGINYYDIYGKEKPSQSEGFFIRVTIYSNGFQKKEKIILQQ